MGNFYFLFNLSLQVLANSFDSGCIISELQTLPRQYLKPMQSPFILNFSFQTNGRTKLTCLYPLAPASFPTSPSPLLFLHTTSSIFSTYLGIQYLILMAVWIFKNGKMGVGEGAVGTKELQRFLMTGMGRVGYRTEERWPSSHRSTPSQSMTDTLTILESSGSFYKCRLPGHTLQPLWSRTSPVREAWDFSCLIPTPCSLFLAGPFFLHSSCQKHWLWFFLHLAVWVSHTCVLTRLVQMTLTSMNEPVKPSSV